MDVATFILALISGGLLGQIGNWAIGRRQRRLDFIKNADELMEKLRQQNQAWYTKATEGQQRSDAKIAELERKVRERDDTIQTLTNTVEAMAEKLDQRTVDEATVAWARKRNADYERMVDVQEVQTKELRVLREQVKEIPYLRDEVRRLTALAMANDPNVDLMPKERPGD